MIKPSGLEIGVRDSVHQPGARRQKIVYDKAKSKARYKVWLYLEGPDLPYVKSATYTLHPTFPSPVRTVERTVSNPNCALEIWTWGIFNVLVDVEDKSGSRQRFEHWMSYDKELTKDPDQYEEARVG